jgi:hypothetical protein
MKTLFGLIFFTAVINYAQIDTSVCYPLHIGDKWEYYFPGNDYSTVEIISDTIMPNGHKYFVFNEYGVSAWQYQRVEDVTKVYYYSVPDENEYILFDFRLPEKTIWEVSFSEYYWGLYKTWTTNNNILNTVLENREFSFVNIDSTVSPPDTIWNPILDVYPTLVTKYLGISSYIYGLEELVGAYINGVGYGSLVGIKELHEESINDFELYQNFPNPFNPTTTINYSLPEDGYTELKVYNIYGELIETLVSENKSAGSYSIQFSASGKNIASSVYLYTLSSGKYNTTGKMIMMK